MKMKPLRTHVHQQKGLELGVPEELRDHCDPIIECFNFMPRGNFREGHYDIIVEIGSQQGWFAYRCMKQLPSNVKMFCVDTWVDNVVTGLGDYNFQCWMANLAPWFGRRVFPIRGKSSVVARYFNLGIDFLFIDGSHEEEDVYADLTGWVPKVKPGCLIAGHDWTGKYSGGVRKAVKRFREEYPAGELETGRVYDYTGSGHSKTIESFWWYQPCPKKR
jgi:hypothetical protein